MEPHSQETWRFFWWVDVWLSSGNVALCDVSMFCQWVMWGRYKEHKNESLHRWSNILEALRWSEAASSALGKQSRHHWGQCQCRCWDKTVQPLAIPHLHSLDQKHPPLKNRFSQRINPSRSSLLNDNIDKLPIVDVWHWQKIKSKMNKMNTIFQGNNSHAQLCCSTHKCIFLINLSPLKTEINSLSTAIAIYVLPRSVLYI